MTCRATASITALVFVLALVASRAPAAEPVGIRKLAGKHITLVTDLPASPEVDRLSAIFDAAVPLWRQYFSVEEAKTANWHVTGFMMADIERFKQAGLVPDDLPPFKHGYSRGNELWLFDQRSEYYRRHLLLHEGTHNFMFTMLDGCGPPWYMEGIAELLATHQWQDGRLTMGYFPRSRHEVPWLGRIKIVQDAGAAGQPLSLTKILEYDSQAHLQNEAYGWCWTAAAFLDGHPRYRDRFRQLKTFVNRRDFSDQFQKQFANDWAQLADEWQVFVANLEHGYDIERMVIDFSPGKPLAKNWAKVQVAADRGWQSSGVRLEAGHPYQLTASGRYQIADKPRVWWCEPGGVTIRYYHGQPLGILLAAVRPDEPDPTEPSPLVVPIAIGLGAKLTPQATGTLYLRINESAAKLGNNTGSLSVEIAPAKTSPTR